MKRISLLLILCGAFASVSAQETFYKVFRHFQEKYPEYTFSAQLSNYTETDSVAYSTEYQYAIDAPVKNLSPADLDSLLAAFDHELLRVPEGVKYVRNAADRRTGHCSAAWPRTARSPRAAATATASSPARTPPSPSGPARPTT